jgi:phosphatidylinositol alpha-1,6-mannosyltransferase
VTRHLLLTNDFPPKVGGIQSYLWELWRRLEPDDVCVYTTPYEGAAAFDAQQGYRVERSPEPWLGPFPHLVSRINTLAANHRAELIIVDPAVPLGLLAPHFDLPYAVVLHGAEVTIPARMSGSKQVLRRVLKNASFVISAGDYALAEAERCAGQSLKSVVIPPGVDTSRFVPHVGDARAAARAHFDISDGDVVVSTVNRLVPRKGMNLLIDAVQALSATRPEIRLIIGGSGREQKRLQSQIDRLGAPVRLLGRISDDDVVRLYGASDLMAMLCTSRWAGLEQEGFGIVFLEAASAGIPQLAGRSGGAAEAVSHAETGLIVDAEDQESVLDALDRLVGDPDLRHEFGEASRRRATADFDYDQLAERLDRAINAFSDHKR